MVQPRTDHKLTIDDIREQNKDISTFKYWTGALLDLPNYLAHSIGYIIRGGTKWNWKKN